MTAQAEFSLIHRYFKHLTAPREDVLLGIGDDCALLRSPPDHVLAVSMDTLVEKIHFLADVDAENLGYKSLAVGLSDLAAMGAKPAWFTLALTMPEVDEIWLAGFARGVGKLAQRYQMQLVGGDTTQGPLTVSIQVHGFVKQHTALTRHQAEVGDFIYVSGTLGDAGAGLQLLLNQWDDSHLSEDDRCFLIKRLECPTARVELGQSLSKLATSAIDISDGLISDLGHILKQSHVGACLELDKLPLSKAMKKIDKKTAQDFAIQAGDDYELCFIVPPHHVSQVEQQFGHTVTQIGMITDDKGIVYRDHNHHLHQLKGKAYEHFTR